MLFTTKQIRWWRKYQPHITVIRMCSVEIGEVSLLIRFLPNCLFRRCCFRRADTNSTRLLLSVQSPQPLWEVHHPCFARGVPPCAARDFFAPSGSRFHVLRPAFGWHLFTRPFVLVMCTLVGQVEPPGCCGAAEGGKGEKGEMPGPVSMLLAMSP
jgi:hypothetical protein